MNLQPDDKRAILLVTLTLFILSELMVAWTVRFEADNKPRANISPLGNVCFNASGYERQLSLTIQLDGSYTATTSNSSISISFSPSLIFIANESVTISRAPCSSAKIVHDVRSSLYPNIDYSQIPWRVCVIPDGQFQSTSCYDVPIPRQLPQS